MEQHVILPAAVPTLPTHLLRHIVFPTFRVASLGVSAASSWAPPVFPAGRSSVPLQGPLQNQAAVGVGPVGILCMSRRVETSHVQQGH